MGDFVLPPGRWVYFFVPVQGIHGWWVQSLVSDTHTITYWQILPPCARRKCKIHALGTAFYNARFDHFQNNSPCNRPHLTSGFFFGLQWTFGAQVRSIGSHGLFGCHSFRRPRQEPRRLVARCCRSLWEWNRSQVPNYWRRYVGIPKVLEFMQEMKMIPNPTFSSLFLPICSRS